MRGLMLIAAMMLPFGTAAVAQPSHRATAAADQTAIEARNKQVVLDAWNDVITGRNIANAPKYFVEDYIQHSPSAGQGRAAMMEFLKKEFNNAPPLPKGSYPPTKFEFVLADGDLVQLMFQRTVPHPHDTSRTIKVWWYDTYRVKDGMIVEHWDSALE